MHACELSIPANNTLMMGLTHLCACIMCTRVYMCFHSHPYILQNLYYTINTHTGRPRYRDRPTFHTRGHHPSRHITMSMNLSTTSRVDDSPRAPCGFAHMLYGKSRCLYWGGSKTRRLRAHAPMYCVVDSS